MQIIALRNTQLDINNNVFSGKIIQPLCFGPKSIAVHRDDHRP
jgi:hypothetical protein